MTRSSLSLRAWEMKCGMGQVNLGITTLLAMSILLLMVPPSDLIAGPSLDEKRGIT